MAQILILDDDPAISRLFGLMLGRDHTVSVPAHVFDAIARVEAGERFDVIVCDIRMPHMSGFDVHAAVTRIDPEQARRIVFVTGEPAEQELARRNLSNPLLMKPVRAEDLRRIVGGFLPIRLLRSAGRPQGG